MCYPLKRQWGRMAAAAAIAGLIITSIAVTQKTARSQSGQSSVPFKTAPSIAAYVQGSSISLVFRGSDSKYSLFNFDMRLPYGLLSSAQSLMTFLSGGFKFGPQSSAAPAGVGTASQNAALGNFVGDSSFGVAYLDVTGSSSNIDVYQGSASFVYSGSKSYKIGRFPAGVIAADFNQDGKVDLAVPFLGDNTSSSSPGGVAILLSNGAGGFASSVVYSAGVSPISVASLDLNGDGILDLAVADSGSSTLNGGVFVLFGKGDGSFAQAVSVYTAAGASTGAPLSVTAADFNGDGHPDLAAGGADGSVVILLNHGNGTFSTAPSSQVETSVAYVAAGDFNADGHMDLAAAAFDGTVSVFLGDGKGNLQLKSAYVVSMSPDSLIVTDYNGDGKLDLINGLGDARGFGPSDNSGNIDILLGNGDGTFQGTALYPVGGRPQESVTGDFNGDGKLDVAVPNSYPNLHVSVFLGNGDGTLRSGSVTATPDPGNSITAADFNLDGKLDLATNTDLLLGKGDGTFQPPTPLPLAGSPVRAGDFNGDGKPDLAMLDYNGGTVTVLLGKGDGTFQLGQPYTVGRNPRRLVLSDFNRDGKMDLAVLCGFGNGNPASIAILLGKGDGTFQDSVTTFNGEGPYFDLTAGDFNGDGTPDLAVTYEVINNADDPCYAAILIGNGDGTFKDALNTAVPDNGNAFAIAAGDFNGDGKLDLVVSGGELMYLAGNGDGSFQSGVLFLGGPGAASMIVADLDGDHRSDLIIADAGVGGPTSGAILPLLNSGAAGPLIGGVVNGGSFVAGQAIAPGCIVSIFGSKLAPDPSLAASTVPLPLSLNNVSVTINGEQAPLYFVSSGQINVQAPWDMDTSGPATVIVSNNGTPSPPVQVNTLGVSPAVLAYMSDAIAINLDGYLALAPAAIPGLTTHPVARGQAVQLYATGLGAVDHDIQKGGVPASGTIVYARVKPTVLLNGAAIPDADVIFWGLTPQFVGVNQVNIIIPPDAPVGNSVSIQISEGGITSPANAAILAIQSAAGQASPAGQTFDEYANSAERKMDWIRHHHGSGSTEVKPWPDRETIEAPKGLIHDWVASTVIPGATVEQALALFQNPASLSAAFGSNVVDSRLVSHQGSHWHEWLRMKSDSLVPFEFQTEYDIEYRSLGQDRWAVVARSTQINEVDGAGRALAAGAGKGFLQRSNVYWLFEPHPDGLYVECRSISLSRGIPSGLGWILKPMISSASRDVMRSLVEHVSAALR